MKIAVLQLNSNDSIFDNWTQIQKLCASGDLSKTQLLFLPENSLYMRVKDHDDFAGIDLQHPIWKEIKDFSIKHQVGLMFGSIPFLHEGRIYNSTLFVSDKGEVEHLYDKLHLFDIELNSGASIKESETFARGLSSRVFEWRETHCADLQSADLQSADLQSADPQSADPLLWRMGLSICYDLRFPELFQYYQKQQVDVLSIPSAFLVSTGAAHWEVLLRARAIESQCYVIAAAQGGIHKSINGAGKRETFGQSMVVDPWGKVEKIPHDRPEILFYHLKKEHLDKVRSQIPMDMHRQQRLWKEFEKTTHNN